MSAFVVNCDRNTFLSVGRFGIAGFGCRTVARITLASETHTHTQTRTTFLKCMNTCRTILKVRHFFSLSISLSAVVEPTEMNKRIHNVFPFEKRIKQQRKKKQQTNKAALLFRLLHIFPSASKPIPVDMNKIFLSIFRHCLFIFTLSIPQEKIVHFICIICTNACKPPTCRCVFL